MKQPKKMIKRMKEWWALNYICPRKGHRVISELTLTEVSLHTAKCDRCKSPLGFGYSLQMFEIHNNHEIWRNCEQCGHVWDARKEGLTCKFCRTKKKEENVRRNNSNISVRADHNRTIGFHSSKII